MFQFQGEVGAVAGAVGGAAAARHRLVGEDGRPCSERHVPGQISLSFRGRDRALRSGTRAGNSTL